MDNPVAVRVSISHLESIVMAAGHTPCGKSVLAKYGKLCGKIQICTNIGTLLFVCTLPNSSPYHHH